MINQVNYSQSDFEQVLSQVRKFNSKIGSYQNHATMMDFNFNIKLNNGTIIILWEEAQDKNCLTDERLKRISSRFKPN